MSSKLEIRVEWETLDQGLPEEKATFGAIGLFANGVCLTEAEDAFVGRLRTSVHLSGYRLAHWLAWNWWRLRWEAERDGLDWKLAHRLSSIGHGYLWPNITCVSDGTRVQLRASAQPSRTAEPLRYIVNASEVVSAQELEIGVDGFMEKVLGSLHSKGVTKAALTEVWRDVQAERANDVSTRYRRLEAELGFDPDEGNKDQIEELMRDASELGSESVHELASGTKPGQAPPTASYLRALAGQSGYDANLNNCPNLSMPTSPCAAWQLGEDMAKQLRESIGQNTGALEDSKLAELLGLNKNALSEKQSQAMSFCMQSDKTTRVLLRPTYAVGRRFDAARLVGARLFAKQDESFLPILTSRTYRQKLQRAFAAELLCPFEGVKGRIEEQGHGDEVMEEIAKDFKVSELVVRTQLTNKGYLNPEALSAF